MTNALVTGLLAAALAVQSPLTPAVVRIGPTGAHFTPDDLAQIARLAERAGGKPWLLIGLAQPFDPRPQWPTQLYFEPDRSAPGIRRGRALTLVAHLASREDYASTKTWDLLSTFAYAQVTAAGREPSSVEGTSDPHRPFRVYGDISDEVLLAVVSLVRSSPVTPSPAGITAGQPISPLLTQVQGTLPIVNVGVEDDNTIAVSLGTNPSGYAGQIVYVRGAGSNWAVTRLAVFAQ